MAKAGAAEMFPDIHYKMSKKIAQLTKVIYQLNTKNEDHQMDLEAQSANHTAEIQLILRDAAAKICKFKDSLEGKQKQVNEEAYVEKLLKKHEAEKQRALQDLAAYKSLAADNEDKLARSYTSKFSALKTQVDKSNEEFVARVAQFEASFTQLKKSSDETTTKLKQKHDADVNALIAVHNRKYEDALNESVRARQAAEAEATRRLEQAQSELRAEMTREMEQQQGLLRAQLGGDKQEALIVLRRDLEGQMLAQRNQLTDQHEDALRQLRVKTSEFDVFKSESVRSEAALRGKVEELQRFISQQEGDVDANRKALLAQVSATAQELSRRNSQVAEQTEEIERLERLLSQNNVRVAELEARAVANAAELADVRESQRLSAQSSKTLEAELRGKLSGVERERDMHAATIVSLQQRIEVLQKDSSSLQRDLEAEVAALRGKLEVTVAELSAAVMSTAAADEKAALLEAMSQRELELANERIKSEESLRVQYSAEMRQLGDEMAALAAAHAREEAIWRLRLDEAAETHAATVLSKEEEMRGLVASNATVLEEMRSILVGAQAELDDHKVQAAADLAEASTRINALEEALKEDEEKRHLLSRELAEAMDRLAELDAALAVSRNEIQSKSSSYEDQLCAVREKLLAEWEEKLRVQSSSHARDMDTQREEHGKSLVAALERQQLEHSSVLAGVGSELDQRVEELERTQSTLSAERLQWEQRLQQASGTQEELQRMFDVAMQKEREDFKVSLQTELSKLEAEMQAEAVRSETALREEHQRAAEDLRRQHEQAMSDLKKSFEGDSKQQSRALEDKFSAGLKELREQLQLEKRNALSDLEAQHRNSVLSTKAASDEAIAALNKKLAEDSQRLGQLEIQLGNVSKQLDNAKADYSVLSKQSERDREMLQREADERLAREKELSEKTRMQNLERFTNEIGNLKFNHQTALEALEAQRLRLLDQNAALEMRWVNRDSRPEDVERIRQLEDEVVEKNQLLQRTKEEMMYFKREMINREESYNTKFNVSPVVGVMNVVKNKELKKGKESKNADPGRRASVTSAIPTTATNLGVGLSSTDDNTMKAKHLR